MWFACFVIVAALMSIGGLIAATWIKSPAQLAAETAPPPATSLTASVVLQPIQSTVVFRGTVANPQQYTATPGGDASNGGASAGGSPLITAEPTPSGSTVHAGQVLVEVSGRPLVILPGSTPAYRAIAPCDVGRDVTELQQALTGLGYRTGSDPLGTYGAGTRTAVANWYRALGYPVSQAGDQAALTAAQNTLTQAQRQLVTVQNGATPPGAGAPAATQLTWAKQDVATAQQAYNQLVGCFGAQVPLGEVLFVPTLPATLAGIGGAVGASVKAPLVTVAVGAPTVTGRLDPTSATLVHTGQQVTITDQLRNIQTTGTVTAIGALTQDTSSQGQQQQPPYIPVTIAATLPQTAVGDDTELSIDTDGGHNPPQLTVPVAAIFAHPDGKLYLTVQDPGHGSRQVAVRTGASGDGRVAITPDAPDQVKAGDTVVLDSAGH